MNKNYISPVGYVDLDNDCDYSIDLKTTRSRESVVPKEDLWFYFETYLVPKYGLGNINVNNVASFMKDLEMNWTKLDQGLKNKVLDIMVDGILVKDSGFKTDLLAKLNGAALPEVSSSEKPSNSSGFANITKANKTSEKSKDKSKNSKSTFGVSSNNLIIVGIILIIAIIAFFIFSGSKKVRFAYPKRM